MHANVSLSLLILRITLGVVFFAHGAQKALGWFGGRGPKDTLEGWASRFNITKFWGVIGIFTEFVGSIAVAVGLLTRPAALGLAVFIFVAMYKVHWGHGFFLHSEGKRGAGIEYCLTLFLMCLAVLFAGGGAFSLDHLWAR